MGYSLPTYQELLCQPLMLINDGKLLVTTIRKNQRGAEIMVTDLADRGQVGAINNHWISAVEGCPYVPKAQEIGTATIMHLGNGYALIVIKENERGKEVLIMGKKSTERMFLPYDEQVEAIA